MCKIDSRLESAGFSLEQGALACEDPTRAFLESPILMLAAAREVAAGRAQASRKVMDAASEHARLLSGIDARETGAEIIGLLGALDSRMAACAVAVFADCIVACIPELDASRGFPQVSRWHDRCVWDHALAVLGFVDVSGFDSRDRIILRSAALLHDIAKPACATVDDEGRSHFYGHPAAGAPVALEIMLRLGMDPVDAELVSTIVRCHDDMPSEKAKSIRRLMRRLGGDPTVFRMWLEISRADIMGHSPAAWYSGKRSLASLDEIAAIAGSMDELQQ